MSGREKRGRVEVTREGMKFELHRKVRWEPAPISRQAYFAAVGEYYRHLSRLDFSTNKTLLRYFGDSFFHDGDVRDVYFDFRSALLELLVARLDDLEDINNYRKRKQLTPIPRSRYLKKPVLYQCRFTGVVIGPASLNRLRNRQRSITIIDTEIHKTDRQGTFMVLISTGPGSEIEFMCQSCSVRIISSRSILHYTGGLSSRFPHCALCRSKLLNPAKVLRVLRDAQGKHTGRVK